MDPDNFSINDGILFSVDRRTMPTFSNADDPYVASVLIDEDPESDWGGRSSTFDMRRSWVRNLGVWLLKDELLAQQAVIALITDTLRKDEITETELHMVSGALEGLRERIDTLVGPDEA